MNKVQGVITEVGLGITHVQQVGGICMVSPCVLSWSVVMDYIETTSVLLVVDIYVDSHPNRPSVHHTDEPQQGWNSCLWV